MKSAKPMKSLCDEIFVSQKGKDLFRKEQVLFQFNCKFAKGKLSKNVSKGNISRAKHISRPTGHITRRQANITVLVPWDNALRMHFFIPLTGEAGC